MEHPQVAINVFTRIFCILDECIAKIESGNFSDEFYAELMETALEDTHSMAAKD